MAKSPTLVRVELRSFKDGVYSHMNVYVDAHPQLALNSYITLPNFEDPEEQWQVCQIHETVERTSIKTGWNNNI